MIPSIPDDGTMDAALYGSAHIETLLAKETGNRILRSFREGMAADIASIDLDLAASVMTEAPWLVFSDEALDPKQWPADILDAVMLLRDMTRRTLGARIVEQWVDDADHRGRLIGLGEHSARASVSGSSDGDYKAAVQRVIR